MYGLGRQKNETPLAFLSLEEEVCIYSFSFTLLRLISHPYLLHNTAPSSKQRKEMSSNMGGLDSAPSFSEEEVAGVEVRRRECTLPSVRRTVSTAIFSSHLLPPPNNKRTCPYSNRRVLALALSS